MTSSRNALGPRGPRPADSDPGLSQTSPTQLPRRPGRVRRPDQPGDVEAHTPVEPADRATRRGWQTPASPRPSPAPPPLRVDREDVVAGGVGRRGQRLLPYFSRSVLAPTIATPRPGGAARRSRAARRAWRTAPRPPASPPPRRPGPRSRPVPAPAPPGLVPAIHDLGLPFVGPSRARSRPSRSSTPPALSLHSQGGPGAC